MRTAGPQGVFLRKKWRIPSTRSNPKATPALSRPCGRALRVKRFDDLLSGVLIGDGAAEPDDLAASAEPVHEEGMQAVDVAWALPTAQDLDATTVVRALGTWVGQPA
ncbi:hypothetical protein [Micromonospora zamorensis]|uniref:hypothetical protein n=1 Tax=Micromonospora zamorensis TaxID=709883 RepID=UPI002E1FBB0B